MTDVEKDIEVMLSVIGYPNNYFYPICEEMLPGLWDNVPCSEIACCISYMAGNLSKIYVSNYAEGLANLYRANGRFGHIPQPGAFIWFDYGAGVPEHTGRVWKIENGIVYTVEGNVGGIVRQLTYSINSSIIYGYGYPEYTGQQMDTYEVRTKSPAGEGLPEYNTVPSGGWNSNGIGNGAISGANVLNNAMGYAQGRLVEVHNQLYPNNQITSAADNIYSIFNGLAENWYNVAIDAGMDVGQVPKYASLGIWYNSSENKGHVAFVENYVDNKWEITQSHWSYPYGQGSWEFSRLDSTTANYLPLFIASDPNWVLLGFIYPYDTTYPPPGPEPPVPAKPKKRKWWIYLKRLPF